MNEKSSKIKTFFVTGLVTGSKKSGNNHERKMIMDRKLYLDMCQKVSVLPQGVGGIKQNVPEELCVLYKGVKWYPDGLLIKFDEVDAATINIAVLHDLQANSIKHGDLRKVERVIP